MIKSPLRYPGGKSRAVDVISEIIPNFKEFREPFLGGGSIFVYLKQKFPDRKYWINDIYEELYHFWKQSQIDITHVIDQIYTWRQKFHEGKELHKFLKLKMSSFNNIEKAAAFFIFNRITFSGTSLSGGFSEHAYQGRFTESSIQRLYPFANLLDNTLITNHDYSELLTAQGDDVFIFLDPPYYSATKSALYGKNGNLHKIFDHEKFVTDMKNCNHKWLITYDDSEYIRDLFSFAYIYEWDLTYGMRNVGKNSNQIGKELFISNYLEEYPSEKQYDIFADSYKTAMVI